METLEIRKSVVTQIISSALLGVLTLLVVGYLWRRRFFYYYAWKVPGPFALPILGNALNFAGNSDDILNKLEVMIRTYGPLCRFWAGSRLVYAISEPEHVQIVLNASAERERVYALMKKAGLGNGIFTAPVSIWKKNRKIIANTFNQKTLNSFVKTFDEQSTILVEALKKNSGNFDVFPPVHRCILDIVGLTEFSTKLNCQTEESEFVEWMNQAGNIIVKRIFKVWLHPEFLWRLSPLSTELDDLMVKGRRFAQTVIDECRQQYYEWKKLEQQDQEDYFDGIRRPKALLDYLIQVAEEEDAFTDEGIIDEILTIMFTGSDTSSSAISSMLVMMGMHPDIQENLYDEMCTIFGDSDRAVCVEDLPKMTYLDQVIKETLRLFPSGPIFARQLVDDVKLGSTTLPRGASCVVVVPSIHRNPEYWPDPLKFDPDRFLPEEVEKRHPCTYIPFSVGIRNCVGLNYGVMVMKCVISTIVRKLKISTTFKNVEDIKTKMEIILKCIDGHNISVTPRTK